MDASALFILFFYVTIYWTGTDRQLRKQSSYCSNQWPAQCKAIDSERHRDPGQVTPISVNREYDTSAVLQNWFIFFFLLLSLSACLCVYFLFCVYLDDVHRYRTVLGETIQTDSLFSSSSLRGLEEALFCQTGHVGSAPAAAARTSGCSANASGAWDAYWERNEPLRDVDEVAIPVLSVCAKDDPVRGDTQSTVPMELFETNPHFFLLLTDRGGHCGFSSQSERSATGVFCADSSAAAPNCGVENRGTSWSHKALLEFFRATTDFFAAEERAKQLAARRRGLGGSMAGRVFRHRSVSTCKRVPVCSHNIRAIYNWQRSYTRWWSLVMESLLTNIEKACESPH